MKKIVAILLCASFVFAEAQPSQDDFKVCYEKLKNSQVYIDELFGVILEPNLIAVVPKDGKKPKKFLKFDPYLGLYLVSSSTALAPAKLGDERLLKKSDWVGIIDHNNTQMGHIKSLGENLGILDTLSFKADKVGMISAPCCNLVGISVGDDKFIGSRYLKNFAKSSEVFYGDIGVNFEEKASKIIVSKVNPLGRGKMLLQDDEILSINGIKPTSVREANEIILFSNKDDVLKFEISRSGETINFKIPVSQPPVVVEEPKPEPIKPKPKPKPKPANVGLAMLEEYGLVLNPNLTIKSVKTGSNAKKAGFERGDKILKIDWEYVKNLKEIDQIMLRNDRDLYYFLISRDDFQFFIKVRR